MAPNLAARTPRLVPPPTRSEADPALFVCDCPLEVYAAYGLNIVYGGMRMTQVLDGDPGRRLALPLVDLASKTMPEISAEACPPDDGPGIRLTAGPESHHLDWWVRDYDAGGTGVPGRPWKPFAGRLDMAAMLPPLVDEIDQVARGLPLLEALHAGGGWRYHDWSGLDPAKTWTALSLGFSPNQHDDMVVVGRPVMMLFALIGLQHHPLRRVSTRAVEYDVTDHLGGGVSYLYRAPVVSRGEYHFSAGWAEEVERAEEDAA